MLVLAMLAATAGAVVAYGDPDQIARSVLVTSPTAATPWPTVHSAR